MRARKSILKRLAVAAIMILPLTVSAASGASTRYDAPMEGLPVEGLPGEDAAAIAACLAGTLSCEKMTMLDPYVSEAEKLVYGDPATGQKGLIAPGPGVDTERQNQRSTPEEEVQAALDTVTSGYKYSYTASLIYGYRNSRTGEFYFVGRQFVVGRAELSGRTAKLSMDTHSRGGANSRKTHSWLCSIEGSSCPSPDRPDTWEGDDDYNGAIFTAPSYHAPAKWHFNSAYNGWEGHFSFRWTWYTESPFFDEWSWPNPQGSFLQSGFFKCRARPYECAWPKEEWTE